MSFPLAPTVGQQHTVPSGTTYEFTATGAWKKVPAGGGIALPADAVGVLTNDGVGGLSWETDAALADRVYSFEDNTLSAPPNAFGTDGETALVSDTAGTTIYRFTKRLGVWVADPGNGASGSSITGSGPNILVPDNTINWGLRFNIEYDTGSPNHGINFLQADGVSPIVSNLHYVSATNTVFFIPTAGGTEQHFEGVLLHLDGSLDSNGFQSWPSFNGRVSRNTNGSNMINSDYFGNVQAGPAFGIQFRVGLGSITGVEWEIWPLPTVS